MKNSLFRLSGTAVVAILAVAGSLPSLPLSAETPLYGSYKGSIDYRSSSPVSVVTAEEIEQQGTLDVADVLNAQIFAGFQSEQTFRGIVQRQNGLEFGVANELSLRGLTGQQGEGFLADGVVGGGISLRDGFDSADSNNYVGSELRYNAHYTTPTFAGFKLTAGVDYYQFLDSSSIEDYPELYVGASYEFNKYWSGSFIGRYDMEYENFGFEGRLGGTNELRPGVAVEYETSAGYQETSSWQPRFYPVDGQDYWYFGGRLGLRLDTGEGNNFAIGVKGSYIDAEISPSLSGDYPNESLSLYAQYTYTFDDPAERYVAEDDPSIGDPSVLQQLSSNFNTTLGVKYYGERLEEGLKLSGPALAFKMKEEYYFRQAEAAFFGGAEGFLPVDDGYGSYGNINQNEFRLFGGLRYNVSEDLSVGYKLSYINYPESDTEGGSYHYTPRALNFADHVEMYFPGYYIQPGEFASESVESSVFGQYSGFNFADLKVAIERDHEDERWHGYVKGTQEFPLSGNLGAHVGVQFGFVDDDFTITTGSTPSDSRMELSTSYFYTSVKGGLHYDWSERSRLCGGVLFSKPFEDTLDDRDYFTYYTGIRTSF